MDAVTSASPTSHVLHIVAPPHAGRGSLAALLDAAAACNDPARVILLGPRHVHTTWRALTGHDARTVCPPVDIAPLAASVLHRTMLHTGATRLIAHGVDAGLGAIAAAGRTRADVEIRCDAPPPAKWLVRWAAHRAGHVSVRTTPHHAAAWRATVLDTVTDDLLPASTAQLTDAPALHAAQSLRHELGAAPTDELIVVAADQPAMIDARRLSHLAALVGVTDRPVVAAVPRTARHVTEGLRHAAAVPELLRFVVTAAPLPTLLAAADVAVLFHTEHDATPPSGAATIRAWCEHARTSVAHVALPPHGGRYLASRVAPPVIEVLEARRAPTLRLAEAAA